MIAEGLPIRCVGGPFDGGYIAKAPKDKCICAHAHGSGVVIYWRNGDSVQYIRTFTREEYEQKLSGNKT